MVMWVMISQHRIGSVLALVLVTQGLTGCGGSERTSVPSAPSQVSLPSSPPLSLDGIVVTGIVQDTVFRTLAGVTVEILDGPHAGMSTVTGSGGWYSLRGAFDDSTRFRAIYQGYHGATKALGPICTGCAARYLHFSLGPLAAPTSIAGNYDLTFVVDTACRALPEELRTRSFRASIVPSTDPGDTPGASFWANLSGATFFEGHGSFPVGVAGSRVVFLVEDDLPYIVEEVAPDTYLAFAGRTSVDVSDGAISTISARFHGLISYCTPSFQGGAYCYQHGEKGCESENHRFILTRR
jgi:hypothetical protein